MILPDWQITQWAQEGGVSPFAPELVNPASIDLRLGASFKIPNYRYFDEVERAMEDANYTVDYSKMWQPVEGDEVWVLPNRPILATTLEYITLPPSLSGAVYLKSSAARRGLDHALAGWVDPAFHGELTLEFHAHVPIKLQAGGRYCQFVLMQMANIPLKDYTQTGRYNGQRGATEARE